MAEVKLLLKSSSEQAKLQLIGSDSLDKSQEEFYKGNLVKFDSVEQSEYEKV